MKKNLMLCALLLSVLLSGCAAEPLQGQTAGNTPKAPTPQEETPAFFETVSTDSSAPTKAPTEAVDPADSMPNEDKHDIDMTMLEAFVKERNEALFSLDRKKIEAYMIKYGETEIAQTPDVVFWASVYKAICSIKDAPEAIVNKAKAWLHEHGMSPYLAG